MLRIIRKRSVTATPTATSTPESSVPPMGEPDQTAQTELPQTETPLQSQPDATPSETVPPQPKDEASQDAVINPEVPQEPASVPAESAQQTDEPPIRLDFPEDDRPEKRKVVCATSNPGPVANDTGYTFQSPKTGDIVRVLHRDDESREEAIARVRKAHGL